MADFPDLSGDDGAVRVDGERFPIDEVTVDGVCVVTVRASPQPQHATHDVLTILAEITNVSLVTTALSPESPLHGEFEVDEVASRGSAPDHVFSAVVRFLINQIRLCLAIAGRNEDVVWFFGATAYVLPVVTARVFGKRVVLQSRGNVPLTLRLKWEQHLPRALARALASVVRALERLTTVLATRVVFYSPGMAESMGLDPGHRTMSTLGSRYVDLERFRVTTPYDDRARVVGFIGRLDVEKGIDILASTVRYLPDDVTFVFVGDGPSMDSLQHSLDAEIDDGRVELVGWVDHDEVPTQLNRFRLLVMPSEPTEGLPTTIAEAFACGTPVYATPVAGISDLVADGQTGFHMMDTDPAQVAATIESILERDDLPEISARCRAVAEDRYALDAAVDRYRAILGGL